MRVLLGCREREDVGDVFRAGEQHQQAVDTDGNAAGRGHPRERVEESFVERKHLAAQPRALALLVLEAQPLLAGVVELGEAVSLGTENAAVLTGGKVMGGPLARQARFAMYTARLPTWHHRLRVGASWFFEGTAPRPLQPLGF